MSVKWKEIETPKGVLKYRFPNIAEGYDFLAAVNKIECAQDVFKLKGAFATKMGPMIDFASLGYSSYDEFLNDRDNNFEAVSKIADEILFELTRTLGKKILSPMP